MSTESEVNQSISEKMSGKMGISKLLLWLASFLLWHANVGQAADLKAVFAHFMVRVQSRYDDSLAGVKRKKHG